MEKRNKLPNGALILGMHRAGTSLLTGSLEEAGLFLGDVRTWSPFNRKGNRENPVMQRFQNQLLAKNNAAWHDPPRGQCAWQQEDYAAATELLKPLSGARPLWGFKDPRTIWTLSGWLELLQTPKMVAIYRHPVDVALSLAKRGKDSVPFQKGMALWTAYNKQLLELVTAHDIPLLRFPAKDEDLTGFLTLLRSLCNRWGLGNPSTFAFPDRELIHHHHEPAPLPKEVAQLMVELEDRAL